MSEVEKKESQKTVVAFVTGLLIGGLLVWVFSATPNNTDGPKTDDVKVDESSSEVTQDEGTNQTIETKADTKKITTSEIVGEGAITITDQKAGSVVEVAVTKYPTKNGWVVIRDFKDGVLGNILGAGRYSIDEGLTPTSVELVRETTAGNTYQAMFYTNEGDIGFNLGEDLVVDGISATFKAI